VDEGPVLNREGRRARISRPTPSHLFAQRQDAQPDDGNGGEPPLRPTRVIPALAGMEGPDPSVDAPWAGPPTPDGAATPADYPPDLVFIVRADGKVLFLNRPLGDRPEDEVIGTEIYDWVFPDQHQVVRDCLGRVFSSGKADGHDLNGIQHHNARAWYECRVSPNHRDGKVVSATIIARDVSRYKGAEHALNARLKEVARLLEDRDADLAKAKGELAERADEVGARVNGLLRFRSLVDEAGEAIFVTDAQSLLLVDVNETACRWLQRRRMDLIGADVSTLGIEFEVVPPNRLDLQFTETRDTRRPLVLEGGIHRRGDGSAFPVEVAVARHLVGEQDLLLAVVRDVKGRRQAEEALVESEARYSALFQQSWDGVYLTTRAGEIVEANGAALQMFGYAREQFIGLDARILLPRPEDIRRFQQEMASMGRVERMEVRMRTKSGDVCQALVSATRQVDASGQLRGYQWIVRVGAETSGPAEEGVAPAGLERETVLLVEPQFDLLQEARSALEHAGLRVITAQDSRSGLEVLNAHAQELAAAIVAVSLSDGSAVDLIGQVRAASPDAHLVLVSPDDPFALSERFGDLRIAAYLRRPAHPLTLVQTTRDLVNAPRH
jgi:PAS domain S-box-containing protein